MSIEDKTQEGTDQTDTSNTGEDTTHQANEVDYEAEARKMGWRPETEYKGKAPFVDAKTFWENGEKFLPIVKAENRALRTEVDRLAAQGKEFAAVMERAHAKEVGELKEALSQAKAARAQAITDGDGAAHEEADSAVKAIEGKLAKPPPKTPQDLDPTQDPVYLAWVDEHPRIKEDEDVFLMCEGLAKHSMFKPFLGKGKEYFDAVYAEAVKRVDKGKDRDLERPGPARGGRGNDDVGRRGGGSGQHSYDNLQPEFKQTCDRMARDYGYTEPAKLKAYREKYVQGCTDEAFKG